MEEAREPVLGRRKSILVLDKSFVVTLKLNIGDRGQMLTTGVIVKEGLIPIIDDREEYVKTVFIRTAEIIPKDSKRVI